MEIDSKHLHEFSDHARSTYQNFESNRDLAQIFLDIRQHRRLRCLAALGIRYAILSPDSAVISLYSNELTTAID